MEPFSWVVWHGTFGVIARKEGVLLVNGAEVGPVFIVPDESARFRQDAALAVLDAHGTELHGAGGVEEPCAVPKPVS